MLPFSTLLVYGNTAPIRPKIQYDFSTGTAISTGQITGSLSGATYGTISSSIQGVTAGTLTIPSNQILLGDYYLEASLYCNSTASAYGNIVTFGNTGIRFGDYGFGNRLCSGSNYNVLAGSYAISQTRTTLYHVLTKFKIQRVSGISTVWLNNVQTNFATGTSTTYSNSSISDTYNISAWTTMSIGTGNVYVTEFTLDF